MNYWIEKTIVKGRADREYGDRALGKVLWSPQKDKRGADIYKNMRKVKEGDIVFHLVNNEEIAGISKVSREYLETNGLEGTAWQGPAYLVELSEYTKLDPILKRDVLLNKSNFQALSNISENSEVFYNKKLNLRQGAYLTPCPVPLASLIKTCYEEKHGYKMTYLKEFLEQTNGQDIAMDMTFSINAFSAAIQDSSLKFSNQLIYRFASSLLTKPFVILTGLSGSGKTKLAEALSIWMSEDEKQYCIVAVGADWTNREPLLGFPNALDQGKYVPPDNGVLELLINATKNPTIPHFLILDEMNMSHVERYFADFLSAMEATSGKIELHPEGQSWENCDVPASIRLPKNLFIIGTVNIDETTYMFSPKVLDRANVIEFRVTEEEMIDFLKAPSTLTILSIAGKGASMGQAFVFEALKQVDPPAELNLVLQPFFQDLQNVGAEFGYRTASEMSRFISICTDLAEDNMSAEDVIDAAIMQKLLPKLHGSRNKLEKVLLTLGNLCLREPLENPFQIEMNTDMVKYSLSFEKLKRMHKRVKDDGFTSYAEA